MPNVSPSPMPVDLTQAPETKPMTKPKGGAVLQMEFSVSRWTDTKGISFNGAYNETPWERIYNIAKTAACDTIRNGGTFILVVGDGKITMVQRAEAVDLEEPVPPPEES